MTIDSALRTEAEYEAALQEAAGLMDAEQGTPEGERLDALTTLMTAYEDEHHRIDPPDAIEAIKFMMEQKGLTSVGLGIFVGGANVVSEILRRERPLTPALVETLSKRLEIPVDVLAQLAPRT